MKSESKAYGITKEKQLADRIGEVIKDKGMLAVIIIMIINCHPFS